MTEESYSEGNAFHLLKQLELILERDTLIDEVGFIHPSQFVSLNEDTDNSLSPSVNSVPQSVDDILCTNLLDVNALQHISTIFWNRDHKLAISTLVLLPLYNAARQAFMASFEQYKRLINLPSNTDRIVNETTSNCFSVSDGFLEIEVMKHSKALLLLSSDFVSAWNSRKLVVSNKQHFSLFMDELLLSALILSYSPKSEHAWSHRRWVIKMIIEKYSDVQEIVERESELVEKIAEKSKMNYRAWNHRCWLITYMTRGQVLNELNKSRRWAELHVADNSCFHYRRRLMLSMLEHNCSKQGPSVWSEHLPDLYHLWKVELDWNAILIKRYIGREALWIHRRFLTQCWIKHFAIHIQDEPSHSDDCAQVNLDNGMSMDDELQLLHSCLTIPDNDFEDGQAQAVLAASYIAWVSNVYQQTPGFQGIELHRRLRELGDLKTLLNNLCPEKTLLWDGLISPPFF